MSSPFNLDIPQSTSTVDVSIINTTSSIHGIHTWRFMQPAIKGHTYLGAPAYSFLIQHHSATDNTTRRLLFDLGIRKDHQNLPPILTDRFKASGYEINVDHSVREILESNSVSCSEGNIEALIWSHWHWDHQGAPSEFPTSTNLIVGPGFKANFTPGYPTKSDCPVMEKDYTDRDLIELDFSTSKLRIGNFQALDYFKDGSFYLLDAPGHAIGHICGLARVTSNPDSYIFMGGDAAHHGGEWRPSPYLPLPEEITPHPFTSVSGSMSVCPGAIFEDVLPEGKGKPFYKPAKLETGQIHHDVEATIKTIEKVQECEGQQDENVFVVVAHDESLLDVVEFFPAKANDFVKKGWVKKARWRFLKDFAEAVGWDGEVEGKREWGPPKA